MKYCYLLTFLFFMSLMAFGQKYNGYLVPFRMQDKWGYCDTNKVIILKPIYDDASFFEGDANVILHSQQGHIDRKGNFTKGYYYNSYVKYHSHHKTEEITVKQKFEALRSKYDSLKYLDIDKRKAYLYGKCGIIDYNDNVLLNIEYDTIRLGGASMYILVKNNKYGFVDKEFKYITNPQYGFVYRFNSEGYAFILLNKKRGVVKKTNVRFFED